MHCFTANSFYKQTCEYSCSKALMSHNMNLLSSHFTISYALHSCETINRKVNCGLTTGALQQISMGSLPEHDSGINLLAITFFSRVGVRFWLKRVRTMQQRRNVICPSRVSPPSVVWSHWPMLCEHYKVPCRR